MLDCLEHTGAVIQLIWELGENQDFQDSLTRPHQRLKIHFTLAFDNIPQSREGS